MNHPFVEIAFNNTRETDYPTNPPVGCTIDGPAGSDLHMDAEAVLEKPYKAPAR
jgi:hypothetical protein